MNQAESRRLEALRRQWSALAQRRVLRDQTAYIQDKRMALVHVQQRLADLSCAAAARKREKFSALAASLDAMSPLKVLGRGYAMAQDAEGLVIKRGADVPVGSQIRVTLSEGGLECTVNAQMEGRNAT